MKRFFKPKTIEDIIKNEYVDFSKVDDFYVIVTDNNIHIPNYGKMFFHTKEQALKHLYNEFRWQAVRAYQRQYCEDNNIDFTDFWRSGQSTDITERQIWDTFKKEMAEYYGFEIIQWKYIKHKLYGDKTKEGEC